MTPEEILQAMDQQIGRLQATVAILRWAQGVLLTPTDKASLGQLCDELKARDYKEPL